MALGTSWVKGWKLFPSIPEDTLTGMLRRCLLYGYQIFLLEFAKGFEVLDIKREGGYSIFSGIKI